MNELNGFRVPHDGTGYARNDHTLNVQLVGGGAEQRTRYQQAFRRQGQAHAFKHDHNADDAIAIMGEPAGQILGRKEIIQNV